MKIAIIYPVPFLDSVPIVQSLAISLANEGNQVSIFVVESGKDNNQPKIDHQDVSVHQFKIKEKCDKVSSKNLIPRNLLFLYWVRKEILINEYEHVIGVDPSGLALSGLMCYGKRIKFSYLSLELILWRDKNRMYRGYKLLESIFIKQAKRRNRDFHKGKCTSACVAIQYLLLHKLELETRCLCRELCTNRLFHLCLQTNLF